tara:strand:+ start:1761 stop:2138 length:378 start_codon:yes stop_codon:yes gene_type:complete
MGYISFNLYIDLIRRCPFDENMVDEIWIVQTTLPGDWIEPLIGDWSSKIVQLGLASCIQRSRITSVYKWENSVQSSEEWKIQIKTSKNNVDELVKYVTSNHPYEIPEITFWLCSASEEYTRWIEE